MKRDPRLAPLSREHHAGLMAVLQTRRALDAPVDPDRLLQIGHEFVAFHRDALIPHFRHEEEWLLPRLPDGDAAEELIERTLTDHVALHRYVLRLEKAMGDGLPLDALLVALCDALERHIRFEERELFVFVEKSLEATDLDLLGRQLAVTEGDAVHIPGSSSAGPGRG